MNFCFTGEGKGPQRIKAEKDFTELNNLTVKIRQADGILPQFQLWCTEDAEPPEI